MFWHLSMLVSCAIGCRSQFSVFNLPESGSSKIHESFTTALVWKIQQRSWVWSAHKVPMLHKMVWCGVSEPITGDSEGDSLHSETWTWCAFICGSKCQCKPTNRTSSKPISAAWAGHSAPAQVCTLLTCMRTLPSQKQCHYSHIKAPIQQICLCFVHCNFFIMWTGACKLWNAEIHVSSGGLPLTRTLCLWLGCV